VTYFLDLLEADEKQPSLIDAAQSIRRAASDHRVFDVNPSNFSQVPGAPFAYWVSANLRSNFSRNEPLESNGREVQSGASTMNDFRFLRLWWEISHLPSPGASSGKKAKSKWVTISKGGSFGRYYIDWELKLNWEDDGREIKEHVSEYRGNRGWGYHWAAALNGYSQYFRPGLTWPRRSQKGLSIRVLPSGSIFGDKGPTIFVPNDDKEILLEILAIANSLAFFELVRLQMAFGSYEVGVLERTPLPDIKEENRRLLRVYAREAWSLARTLDSSDETSHAFLVPQSLYERVGEIKLDEAKCALANLQASVDSIAFEEYRFNDADRASTKPAADLPKGEINASKSDDGEQTNTESPEAILGLLSWCLGIAFGRFDWRLATGEREAPSEPEPFDPLPAKSPGMLSEGTAPFHTYLGILVDDPGHQHDLTGLIEEVLSTVDHPTPEDVRRWLQRDFFPHHLRQYSKSRRKAPIYWPLSTTSGRYTLWLYYPALTDQTLYSAANDFIGPKLEEISRLSAVLRARTDRNRDEDRELEQLQDLQGELKDLQDELLSLAPTWKPSNDDGVQITAAPLWRLFRHKPWQKVLKDTWEKLERGDHDWTNLAMSHWPDRVREKCSADKSLAIAHNLEYLYEPPPE